MMPGVRHSAALNMADALLLPALQIDGSVVLIGNRGAGASTLALILSNHIRWTVVDATEVFEKDSGLSRAGFQEEHGVIKYRQQHSTSLRKLLHHHTEKTIIVCGPACLDGDGPQLLREYARTHAIVHIGRDRSCIQGYLGKASDQHFAALIEYTDRLISSCSNCEFFNLSQTRDNVDSAVDPKTPSSGPPSLMLKKIAHEFVNFMCRMVGKSITTLLITRKGFPLQPECRPYSYVMPISLSLLDSGKISVDEIEPGADVVELNVDISENIEDYTAWIKRAKDIASQKLALLRRHCETPILFHATVSPGSTSYPEILSTHLQLLLHGLRLGCEFVSVDMQLPDEVISRITMTKGTSKIMGHFFDPNPAIDAWRSNDRQAIYGRAQKLGCDLVRLTQSARTRKDNFDVQELTRHIDSLPEPHPALVAYNTGQSGRTSCIFNRTLSPITLSRLKSNACLTLQDAQRALFGAFVLDPLHFHVVGSDISYSLVPSMFRAAFEWFGMPHTFNLLPSSSLAGLARKIRDDSFGGATFPPPFKTDIVPLLDILSPSASVIGAVNILIPLRYSPDFRGSGSLDARYKPSRAGPIKALYGDNTDWLGIKSCIYRSLSPANSIKPSTTGLVVGAGGTARAAVFAMLQLGIANIFVLNRTAQRAYVLAEDMNNMSATGTTTPIASDDFKPRGTVHVLLPGDTRWPADHDTPTVIVSCVEVWVDAHIPLSWRESRTGGVFLQVSGA